MSRLISVPQYPTPMRYQQWWIADIPNNLDENFDDIIILGDEYLMRERKMKNNESMFSPIDEAIIFEEQQIYQYLNLDLREDDILLLNDISFPGLFSNILYHKKPKKCFAICHATSKNAHDYFAPVRKSKWKTECAHSELFDKIFVGTEYHKNKLGWDNVVVTSLPEMPFSVAWGNEKINDVINVSRPTKQKVNKKMEKIIENKYGEILRETFYTWEEYFKFLNSSKCLFISASEETFGYQVVDAINNGCIPVAPNKFSYPELLSKEYLYDTEDEAIEIVGKVLNGDLDIPDLLNRDMMDNFYEKITEVMFV